MSSVSVCRVCLYTMPSEACAHPAVLAFRGLWLSPLSNARSAHSSHMLSWSVARAAARRASSVFSVGPGVPDYSGTQIHLISTYIDPSHLNLSPFLTFSAAFLRTHTRLSALCHLHHLMAFKTSMFTALVILFAAFHAGEAYCGDGGALTIVKGTSCCTSDYVKEISYSVDGGSNNDNVKVRQRCSLHYIYSPAGAV